MSKIAEFTTYELELLRRRVCRALTQSEGLIKSMEKNTQVDDVDRATLVDALRTIKIIRQQVKDVLVSHGKT